MPRNITITKRELKNVETGIDMSVLGYDRASSAKNVKDYHVVVITRLPFFKLAEHSEENVVQFMVPRDYAAFERLQKDLTDAFPECHLPGLPRKFHLFMSESDVEDRQVAFDCLVKVISKSRDMCTSVPVLRFLEVDLLADRNYYKNRREFLKRKEEEVAKVRRKEMQIFGDRSEEIDNQGLFSSEGNDDVGLFKDDSKRRQPFAAESLFEESSGSQRPKRSAKISLLGEEEDEELFIPSGAKGGRQGGETFETEDNSELLNVSDNLEDVLHIVSGKGRKTASKQKPRSHAPEPEAMKPGGLFDEGPGIPEMGTDDIMKYIEQNQSTADDDLDLF